MVRLSTRLKQLEQTSSVGDSISVESKRLLVQLLGRTDALFWPFRKHEGSYRAEIRRLQLEYLAGRGGLRAAGQGGSNWKAAHYARQELIAAGLVEPSLAGGQVVSLRLTAQGIADTRAMVGDRLCNIGEKRTIMLLAMLLTFEGCEHSGKWMLENHLFGEEVCKGDNPSEWEWAVDYALPLLRCGAIESTSDLWNRCYFRAMDGVEIKAEPTSTRTLEPWADECYLDAFDNERTALMRLECEDGGIFIPMRCT